MPPALQNPFVLWLVLSALLGVAAWYGIRQVWFLGTDSGGRVALYRGLPYELPFGIELYQERYAAPLQTRQLPRKRRESVTGHNLRSRADAVSLIEDIERSQGVR
jgi:protein phosphatase